MHPVDSGGTEIDFCGTCAAAWFDPGEIRELTEGRLPIPPEGSDRPAPEGDPPSAGRRQSSPISKMHRLAASLACPRCNAPLSAIDYQATGVPVMICSACRGFLVPAASAKKLAERFAFSRVHAARYAAMGESMAAEMKNQLRLKYFAEGDAKPSTGPSFALPVVVPLSTGAPPSRSFPAATLVFLGIPVIFLIFSLLGGVACRLPWPPGGLPAGAGLASVPVGSLLAYPFLPGGLLSLGTGILFLFVLGRPVEERIGTLRFAALYLLGAVVAGAVHLCAGRIGAPAALGGAGAVAAVLGAYLIYFPNVPITMYGMGRVVSAPAYLFACCWALATLMANPETGGLTGYLLRLADPTPLSLWGSLAGLGTGALFGAALRSREEGFL
jgi:membrane associated rhomboid family serine protease/Zn-finger nucleic acid-binding protein